VEEYNLHKSLEASKTVSKKLLEKKLSGDIALITYDKNIVYKSESILLTCSQILAYLAEEKALKNNRILLLLNSSGDDKTLFEMLNQLMKIFEKEGRKSSVIVFGEPSQPQYMNQSYTSIKIDLDWLGVNPGFLTEIIRETSIKKTDFDLKKLCHNKTLTSLDELSSILIKNLGPPSFIEDLSLKVEKGKSVVKMDEAGAIAAGVESFIIASSPTLLLLKGIKYISGLYNIFKHRHDENNRKFLEKWAREVSEGYSKVKLAKYFETGASNSIIKMLEENNITILLNLTVNTIYELFYPTLLYNIMNLIELKELKLDYVFFDNLSYFAKTEFFTQFFHEKLINKTKKFNLIVSLSTKDQVNAENLEDIIKYFSARTVIYFDISSDFLNILMGDHPLSEMAQILQSFAEMKKLKDEQILTFVYFNSSLTPSWQIIKIPLKLTHKFKLLMRK